MGDRLGILGAVDLNSFGTKIKKIYNIENACNFMPISTDQAKFACFTSLRGVYHQTFQLFDFMQVSKMIPLYTYVIHYYVITTTSKWTIVRLLYCHPLTVLHMRQ